MWSRATARRSGTSVECDGLDADDVSRAIDEAIADPRPSLIRCRTIIGFGAPNKQGTAATHGAALGEDEVEAARRRARLEDEEFWFRKTCSPPGASRQARRSRARAVE